MTRAALIGGGVGAALAALAWPSARASLDRLDAVRAGVAEDRAQAAPVDTVPNAAWRLRAGSAPSALASVAQRVRQAASGNGVLVEREAAADPIGPGVAQIDLTLSGPEKAVLAIADRVEREGAGARWQSWRLQPAPGGVRLSGSVAVAWR
ncbi:hypothetical protein [Sphingomonas sp. Y38-1Y]|uniref:hypothetical protein n=1 Tax=Sphingomonas sp. Y38-1Y TaxID=3078265 RepID=UPI0028E9CB08|nr:hypothetical protein [Sphingomonas sp. Y38-1Y]